MCVVKTRQDEGLCVVKTGQDEGLCVVKTRQDEVTTQKFSEISERHTAFSHVEFSQRLPSFDPKSFAFPFIFQTLRYTELSFCTGVKLGLLYRKSKVG